MKRDRDEKPSGLARAGYVGAGALTATAAPLLATAYAEELFRENQAAQPKSTWEFSDAMERIREHAAVKEDAPYPVFSSTSEPQYILDGRDSLADAAQRALMPEKSRGLIVSDGRVASLLHELGHATGRGGVSPRYARLAQIAANKMMPATMLAGTAFPYKILQASSDEELDAYEKGLNTAAVVPTALMTPTLIEEARANIRGAGFARKFGYDVPARNFLLPMATYLAAPLAASGAVYGIGRLALRRMRGKKEEDSMGTGPMRKLAQLKQEQEPWYKRVSPGALASGAIGLAGLGVGARRHMNVRKLSDQLQAASRVLGSATEGVDKLKPALADATTASTAANKRYADEVANTLGYAGDYADLRERLFEGLRNDPDFVAEFVQPSNQARAKLTNLQKELRGAEGKRDSAASVVNTRTKGLGEASSSRNFALGVGGAGVGGAALLGSMSRGEREQERPQPAMLGVRR